MAVQVRLAPPRSERPVWVGSAQWAGVRSGQTARITPPSARMISPPASQGRTRHQNLRRSRNGVSRPGSVGPPGSRPAEQATGVRHLDARAGPDARGRPCRTHQGAARRASRACGQRRAPPSRDLVRGPCLRALASGPRRHGLASDARRPDLASVPRPLDPCGALRRPGQAQGPHRRDPVRDTCRDRPGPPIGRGNAFFDRGVPGSGSGRWSARR